MDSFLVGSRVKHKTNGRRDGLVVHICCKLCSRCQSKEYASCTALAADKLSVISRFQNDKGEMKLFHHKRDELEPEKESSRSTLSTSQIMTPGVHFYPKDIRAIGVSTIEIPSISSPEFEDEIIPAYEAEEEPETVVKNTGCRDSHVTNDNDDTTACDPEEVIRYLREIYEAESDPETKEDFLKWLNEELVNSKAEKAGVTVSRLLAENSVNHQG